MLLLVFSKPRKLDTESELYDVALRALMRRPHSVHEIRNTSSSAAPVAIFSPKSSSHASRKTAMIDDSCYAKQFVRQRSEIRRQGKFRIARDLRARGVPDAYIQSAIEDASDEAA